jgi:hypothetical protein
MAEKKPTRRPKVAATKIKHCDDSERRGHEALPQRFYDLLGWPMASMRMEGACPLCPHDMGCK